MHTVSSFDRLWLAETLRLQETRDGPLDDQAETLFARQAGGDMTVRILNRAQRVGEREGLLDRLQHWRGMARLAMLALAALAVLSGTGMALGALGDGTRPVSLMQALAMLLGLNTLMLLLWLLSVALPSTRPSGLGGIWLWLTARLSRSPGHILPGQALLSIAQRSRALTPMLGSLTHAIWSLAFVAALAALLGVLSARQYSFQWETTLLSADFFVGLTQALGGLPSVLGFSLPSSEVIAHSVTGTVPALPGAGPMWSHWLIGCVVTWGLLPRLLALLGCLALARLRLNAFTLDTSLPGLAELRPRLMPDSRTTGIDAPAPDLARNPRDETGGNLPRPGGHNAIAGLELPDDIAWPVPSLNALGHDLGRIDTRAQRTLLENTLTTRQYDHLVVACDGRQTPDRGTVLYLQSLAQLCKHLHVIILPLAKKAPGAATAPDAGTRAGSADTLSDAADRSLLWRAELERTGMNPTRIYVGTDTALSSTRTL
ncbi:MAG: DUF2868 domain-containing protein [Pusillimonas sp.]